MLDTGQPVQVCMFPGVLLCALASQLLHMCKRLVLKYVLYALPARELVGKQYAESCRPSAACAGPSA